MHECVADLCVNLATHMLLFVMSLFTYAPTYFYVYIEGILLEMAHPPGIIRPVHMMNINAPPLVTSKFASSSDAYLDLLWMAASHIMYTQN
jgi:hypothetical protein